MSYSTHSKIKNDNKPYNPNVTDNVAIDTFCVNGDCYYIPLYLLVEDEANVSDHEIRLKKILKNLKGYLKIQIKGYLH